MKRKILILLFGILMLLSACGTQAQLSEGVERSDNVEEITKEYIEETVEMPTLTEDIESVGAVEEVIPEEAFDLSDKEPLDALKAVLLNKAPFIYPYSYGVSGKGTVYEEDRGYLEDVLEKHQIFVTRFAIIDMDGDGISEIILEWGNCIGSVLLRYWDGKVFGKEFGYRAMGNIRDDGSSWGSNSAFESFVHRLFFIGDSSLYSTIAEKNEKPYPYESRYYVYDVQVSKEEWQKANDMHDALPEIEWYEFSEEEICKRVSETFEKGEEMVISKERQEYLDTFSYLMELRKSNQSNGQEEYNEAAKRYYYNTIAEMESIYDLYKSTLAGKELEQLETEQKRWQEGIDLRLVKSLYDKNAYSIEELENWGLFFDQGDFYLSRACRLVNRYYGCDFYN